MSGEGTVIGSVLGRMIPPLPSDTILLVEVGSTAHGTGQPGGEDQDELGVVVESPEEVFGAGLKTKMYRTQPEGVRSGPGDTDRTLYSLRTFLHLAESGNPSILGAFYSPVLMAKGEGHVLRQSAPMFVGRHVIPRFRGYMHQQGLRLLGLRGAGGHGKRGSGGRPELIEQYGWDTKFAMHAARLGFQCIEYVTTGKLELPIPGGTGEWLRLVRTGKVDFEEWWLVCLDLDAQMAALESDESIRPEPDSRKIREMSIEMHRERWDWMTRDQHDDLVYEASLGEDW